LRQFVDELISRFDLLRTPTPHAHYNPGRFLTSRGLTPLIALLALFPALLAQAAGVDDCHSVEEPVSRLACYDRATSRPVTAQPQATAEVARDAGNPVAITGNPVSPRGRPATAPLEEPLLNARIVEVLTTSVGRRQFLLENGELWEQLETRQATLRSGDLVNVRPTLFRAWQMRDTAGKQRAVKVRRAN
jgi:hypothetical protein